VVKRKQQEPVRIPARLWTTQEAADFLGVPLSTMYMWSYRGDGPKRYKVGRHLRYDPEEVVRWLQRGAA
jgi:excisionase family DNA binding protein